MFDNIIGFLLHLYFTR